MTKPQEVTRRAPGISGGPAEADSGYTLVLASAPHVVLKLPDHGEAILGRDDPATLRLHDDSVSRKHALIRAAGDGGPPTIEDLGSMNGTKVMGRALAKGERVDLSFGAVVEIGTAVMFVRPAATSSNADTPGHVDVVRDRSGRPTMGPTPIPPAKGGPSAVLADPTMRRLYELIEVIANSKLSILILGETGVGKDVYAETIHSRSPRAPAPLVRLNCAALPENLLEAELFGYEKGAFTGAMQSKPGLFEVADGGSVFLDEIGETPLVTQAKLLRVLESGEVMRIGSLKPKRVDVRFISATNRDLEALSATGQFRSDLFFRLNGVAVALPPLRKRPDDILPLARMFLQKSGSMATFTPDAEQALLQHRWPGNIRELKNVVERAALLAQAAQGAIQREHLLFSGTALAASEPAVTTAPHVAPSPPQVASSSSSSSAPLPIREEYAELERTRILEVMTQCGGNQSRAAKMLGISRTTLIKRLEQYQYVRPRKP